MDFPDFCASPNNVEAILAYRWVYIANLTRTIRGLTRSPVSFALIFLADLARHGFHDNHHIKTDHRQFLPLGGFAEPM
jgi:hypothetical protein